MLFVVNLNNVTHTVVYTLFGFIFTIVHIFTAH